MNKVLKITNKKVIQRSMESQNEALLVVGRGMFPVLVVIYCTSKRCMLIVWDIAGMKKILHLYTILVYSMFLRDLNHQKSIALVTKTCVWGVSSFSLKIAFGHFAA